jgi:subtilisin family serine protease
MKNLVKLLFLLPLVSFAKVKIAVVDTGVNLYRYPKLAKYICENGELDVTGKSPLDVHGHGSNVISIIADKIDPDKACIISVKYYHYQENNDDVNNFIKALELLDSLDVKYVNLSVEGPDFYKREKDAIERLLNKGVKVFVSSGNGIVKFDYKNSNKIEVGRKPLNLKENCIRFPACYFTNNKNFFVVKAKDFYASNYDGPVNAEDYGVNQGYFGVPKMTGTSQASANRLGKYVRDELK